MKKSNYLSLAVMAVLQGSEELESIDIEEFGILSGLIKVTTKKPTKEVSGELNINAGSFGYQKLSGSIYVGLDKVRVLFSVNKIFDLNK